VKTWKWIVLGCVSAPVLFLGSKIEWWFHEEHGPSMAGTLISWKISNTDPAEGRAFASDVCGEPVDFSRTSKTSYWDAMAELPVSRHFFLYGPFRNTVWVAIGAHDKFCLARYEITMRKHDCAWPFPYCNRWSWKSLDEVRLINRIQTRPQAPPGVKAIFPGECVTGRLEAGETAKFQVEIPSFGQEVDIPVVCDGNRVNLEVTISKNGAPPQSYTGHLFHEDPGGGSYRISVRAPVDDFKFYTIEAYWGGGGPDCKTPVGWRETDWSDPQAEFYKR
jgi:hypothetical protein